MYPPVPFAFEKIGFCQTSFREISFRRRVFDLISEGIVELSKSQREIMFSNVLVKLNISLFQGNRILGSIKIDDILAGRAGLDCELYPASPNVEVIGI